jgi:Na+-driven multidrug efflux pump
MITKIHETRKNFPDLQGISLVNESKFDPARSVYFYHGKIRIQLYYAILTAILNIPLSIFLAKYVGLGITGIMVATNISLIFASFWSPIQYHKLINGTAKGIWDK